MATMAVVDNWVWMAALTVCVCHVVWRWLLSQRKKCFTAFEGTGIPVPPLQSLINGHADAFLKQNKFECLGKWLKEYGDVFGFYLGDVPFVVIEDPDMINKIYAQDFSKFTGRGVSRLPVLMLSDALYALLGALQRDGVQKCREYTKQRGMRQ